VTAFGSFLLLMIPGRRKPVVGMVVRRGHVLLLVCVFSLTSLPLPIIVQPAWAGGGGMPTPTRTPTPSPSSTPTRTPTAPGGATTLGVKHYHFDHLGSTQVITNDDGTVFEYVRYRPYGEVRGHWNRAKQSISDCYDDRYCREFTGYNTEPYFELEYAGARVYDPGLGMFLTHDPAAQFANPYLYGGGNPANGTDPNGTWL